MMDNMEKVPAHKIDEIKQSQEVVPFEGAVKVVQHIVQDGQEYFYDYHLLFQYVNGDWQRLPIEYIVRKHG